MKIVPASEFSKNFGRYREMAQGEPIAVTSHERVTGYFISSAEYEEYVRLKSMLPKAYAVEEISQENQPLHRLRRPKAGSQGSGRWYLARQLYEV